MSFEVGFVPRSKAAGAQRPHAKLSTSIPADSDTLIVGMLAAGLLLLYAPTCWDLYKAIWSTDAQSFGPLILGASLWLMWRERDALGALPAVPQLTIGWAVLSPSLFIYAFGRSQNIWLFEVGSMLGVLCGLLLLFKGVSAIKLMSVQLTMLAFLIPWPGEIVAALTGPLKAGVSAAAANLLHGAGYPVGRTGVMLTVGKYQLLVADACAGLSSILTLEAVGLIYMKLRSYRSALHNMVLAFLLVPISFASNVLRVIVLVLITYHFGDESGQGFIHSAAGIVLFSFAAVLMLTTDSVLSSCNYMWRGFKEARA